MLKRVVSLKPPRLYSTSSYFQRVPEINTTFICDPKNLEIIEENIAKRKGIGNIRLIHELINKLKIINKTHADYTKIRANLDLEILKIPNRTHPVVSSYDQEPKIVKIIGEKPKFNNKPLEYHEITKRLKLMRTEQIGQFCGSKSYYFLGELAQLEQALIRYFVSSLLRENFKLVSVPDILPRQVVEGCGMATRGTRTQVYTLDEELHGPDQCLSGTSEMSLAAFLAQSGPITQLPSKLIAVSRCFRAETSNVVDERGIYRVHEFTKVEMFVACLPEQSDEMLEAIRIKQEQLFASLGLHFVVLDMPPHELGAQAYRKYDMEAWMCGRDMFGEISSCSNCLDYQSRRLGVRGPGEVFLHTLNGTACAIPRLLIALVEMGQQSNGTIALPEVLHAFMSGKQFLSKQKNIPELKLIKNKK